MENNFNRILKTLTEAKETEVIVESREENGVVLPDGKTILKFKERATADQYRNVQKAYIKENPTAGYGTLKKLAAMCKPLKGCKAADIIKAFKLSTATDNEGIFEVGKVPKEEKQMNNFQKTLHLLTETEDLNFYLKEIKRITSDKTLTEGVISDVFKKISKAIVKFDSMTPEEQEKLDLMKQMIGEYQKYGKIKTKYLLDRLA